MKRRVVVGIALTSLCLGASRAQVADLTPAQLRCEYREDPLGIDSAHPRLSWTFTTPPGARGLRQTASRILVASSPRLLAADQGDLWDAVRKSGESTQIAYAGKPLAPAQGVFWKVRVQDQSGRFSVWSAPATWTMGMLTPADWIAKWITDGQSDAGSTLLRHEFPVNPGLVRALVFVSGLGQYEMFLNGAKVGRDLLAPGWTDTRKTVSYDTYDVTALLRPGANAAGLALGNGMYNVPGGRYRKFTGSLGPRQAIAQFRLEYADGTVQAVGTDTAWKIHSGPVIFNCVYGGEDYDARLAQAGWMRAGFAEKDWKPAQASKGPGGTLRGLSCSAPPIRAFDILSPTEKKTLAGGTVVYDLGQNASIMPRLSVKGPVGSFVKIIPSELVRENGDIEDTMCKGNSYWTYTLAGTGTETWFPQFFYRGARYLKVERHPAAGGGALPVVESIEGVVVHSAAAPAGSFTCSNELFNRIYSLVRWAQRSNLMSVITDCPTREKLGWLEQYHLNGPSLRDNWNLATLYTKCLQDMQDAQQPNGLLPNIAPEFSRFGGAFRESPEWGAAFVLGAWQQYEFEGDASLLARFYDGMAHYVAYLDGKARGHILDFGLGDWYDLGPKPPGESQLTPRSLTGTAIYFEEVRALGRMARVLDHPDDAKRYEAQAADIRAAFNHRFFDVKAKQYATGSQTANALPVALGIVEEKDRATVVDGIVANIEAHGLTAGDVGYRYLLRALADNGRSDVIYALNNQSDKPGYGLQLARGATSLTEAWDALRASSQNHFMLGQINEWFFHDLAGIQGDPAGPGFQKIIIRPALIGGLASASAAYDSIHGKIRSGWQREGSRVILSVTIPANTTATIFVPAGDSAAVTESGQPAARAPGVKFLSREGRTSVFAIGSGNYRFVSDL